MSKLEDMSVEELLAEVVKAHKKVRFKPKKFKTDEQGTILLDSNNPHDKVWLDCTGNDLI